MTKFGKYRTDGSVETEATECILTGRALSAPFDNTVREKVTGTPFFYRVLGSQYHRVTAEQREQWKVEANPLSIPVEVPGIRSRSAKKEEVSE